MDQNSLLNSAFRRGGNYAETGGFFTRLSVFFDKQELATAAVPDHEVKAFLIQKLAWAAHSARACIVFAAALRDYRPTAGFGEQAAVARGLATSVDGMLVEWSLAKVRARSTRKLPGDRDQGAGDSRHQSRIRLIIW